MARPAVRGRQERGSLRRLPVLNVAGAQVYFHGKKLFSGDLSTLPWFCVPSSFESNFKTWLRLHSLTSTTWTKSQITMVYFQGILSLWLSLFLSAGLCLGDTHSTRPSHSHSFFWPFILSFIFLFSLTCFDVEKCRGFCQRLARISHATCINNNKNWIFLPKSSWSFFRTLWFDRQMGQN